MSLLSARPLPLTQFTPCCLDVAQVPVAHGKSDLTIYRDAGAAVINVLSKSAVCERASIDEAYLDVTAAAQRLLAGAALPPKHSSGSNNSSRAAAAAGASASDADEQAAAMVAAAEAAEAAEDEVQEMHEGGVSVGGAAAVLPLPETFDGWHVAGVVSGACWYWCMRVL
jgi:nucleotidyltransferase/DNA polymerase involved in DNA repair